MGIKKLHNKLVNALINKDSKHTDATEKSNSYPPIGKNEVLAKNALKPYNMLAISKTKLEKVHHTEVLGDIYLFEMGSAFYFYSSKLGAYGKGGEIKIDKKQALEYISKNPDIPNITKAFSENVTQKDQVEAYISKDITKFIKSISSKHGTRDSFYFVFKEDMVVAYASKDQSKTSIEYRSAINPKLISKGIVGHNTKKLKMGVWKLIDGKVYDDFKESMVLQGDMGSESIQPLGEHITIKGTAVSKMMNFVKNMVDRNNLKREINYLLVDVKDGMGKFVGTDTRRLSVSNEFKVNGADGQYYIHATHLSDNPKEVKLSKKGVEISFENTILRQEFTSKLIFPDYQRVVPLETKHKIKVDTKGLGNIKGYIYIQIKNNKVYWSNTETHIEDIPDSEKYPLKAISVDSANISFALNSKYLKNAIQGSSEVTIGINDKNVPIVVYGELGLTVIMPIVTETKKEIEEAKKEKERKEQERLERELEEKEREKKEEGIAHDFLNTLTPMQRAKARNLIVDSMIRHNGDVKTTLKYIEELFNDGYYGEYEEYREWSRRKNEYILKKEWVLTNGDASITSTKTETTFLNYLRENPPKR